jgi:hypothetical protein
MGVASGCQVLAENQMYAPLDVPDSATTSMAPMHFPIKAEVLSGPPRMERLDTQRLSVTFHTADDLILGAIQKARSWFVMPAHFEWADGPNLLRLIVTGVGRVFEAKAGAVISQKIAPDNLDTIFLGDPEDVSGVDFTAGTPCVGGDGTGNLSGNESDGILDGVEGDPIVASDLEDDGFGSVDHGDCPPNPTSEIEPGMLDGVPPEEEPLLDAKALESTGCGGDAPPEPDHNVEVEPEVFPIEPPAPVPRPRAECVAMPKANQVVLRDRLFTRLLRHGKFEGYSIRCPTCRREKNCSFANSGMPEDTALDRLIRWADHCRPYHGAWGGILLKDCAV